jgi:hypothetical protein
MAVIFSLPTNVPEAVSTGYQRQNTLSYAMMTGHLSLGLSNMDNSSAPKVLAGSVFEVNAGLFKVTADESVGGSPSTGQNYVYAVPYTGGCVFQYSSAKPAWSVPKGGWYNGNNRAVAKFVYSGGQYQRKEIIAVYGDMPNPAVRIAGDVIEFWQGDTVLLSLNLDFLGSAYKEEQASEFFQKARRLIYAV